jgi:hypothetical protein
MALVIAVVISYILASLSLCMDAMMIAKLYAATRSSNKGL